MRSANLRLKVLADRMLTFKHSDLVNFIHFRELATDPREIITRLRASTLVDLVLPEGASLSMPNGGDWYPDLGATAQDVRLARVSLTALGWSWAQYAAVYPTCPAWSRQVEISLWYARDDKAAPLIKQVFSATAFDQPGLPSLERSVWAEAYAESGYKGHSQCYRKAHRAPEARFFIDLANELFAQTPEGQP